MRPSIVALGSRLVVAACAALALASLGTVLVVLPDGAPVSSDPGAPVVAWWVVLLPPSVGVALALALPPRSTSTSQPAIVTDRRRHRASTWALLVLAIAFPAVVVGLDLDGEESVLAKLLLLLALPALVVGLLHGVRLERAADARRWWAPALVVGAWILLSQVAPWNPRHDLSGIDPTTLVVAATATALTAGVGEELLYRRWLQTRLEAGMGAASGIAVATTAFALMHLGTHGTGEPWLDVARVVVAQGSFGLLMGVLWWRYRSLLAIVVAHVVVNGWPVAASLLP